MQQTDNNYGSSKHYKGEDGEIYFSSQKTVGQISARWNLSLWLKYINSQDSILDFGCGGGYLLSELPAHEKTGVEINPAARREVERQGVEVYPTLNDIPDGRTFSCILSSHALEHVPAPLAALKAMKRLLQPNGKLLLLLPLDDWRAPTNRNFRMNDPNFHLYAWTPQNLGNLLLEGGFMPQEIKILTDAMPPLGIARRIYLHPVLRVSFGRLAGLVLRRRQLWARAVLTDN